MPACSNYVPELKAWIDGELETERAGAVAHHVEGCARCQATVVDFQAVGALLRNLPSESPDQAVSLSAQIPARVAEEENLFRLVRGVAVAAATVLILSLGWLASTPRPLEHPSMTELDGNPLILVISDTPWEEEDF